MPDYDTSLEINPENLLQNQGATALSNPSPSITGALADYANQLPPATSSLGLLMDDRQMRDAGVHPDQSGAAPDVSVIDATGASGRPSADGVADALQGTDLAQAGSHGLGYWTGRAAKLAKDAPMLKGLEGLAKAYTYPLTAAEGVAHGISDVHKGAPAGEAILGNVVRTGLVMGATALGDIAVPIVGAAVANAAADRYLPDGATIGHGIIKQWSGPDVQRAMLSGP